MSAKDDAVAAINNQDAKIKDFSELLTKIEGLNDKQRRLLLEIYSNAIEDRNNAHIMFGKLVDIVGDHSTEHAVHGRTIVQYIERMGKANDQLMKLSEMLRSIDNGDGENDPNDIYKMFGKKN